MLNRLGLYLRSIPSFRGKLRASRLILNLLGFIKNRDILISTKNGNYFLPNLKENLAFELFTNGAYEMGLIKLLNKNIAQGGTFIDIGANIGAITIPLAKMRPDLNIYSIEASPWIYKYLEKNINLNKIENVKIFNFAMANEDNKNIKFYAPKDKFGKGSIKPIFTSEFELVQSIKLSTFKQQNNIDHISMIKVDVEGFEKMVFEGFDKILETDRPTIVFEYVFWAEELAGYCKGAAQTFLLQNNYKLQLLGLDFEQNRNYFKEVQLIKDANILGNHSENIPENI